MLVRWFLLMAFLLLGSVARAGAPVLESLAVLEDASGSASIQSIALQPERFTPLQGASFTGGYTRSVYWLRLRLSVPGGETWLEALPPILDDLRLYVPDAALAGGYQEHRHGDTHAFATREVPYRGF
ncbi:MAG: 7TMR-DISMED2 domain-containing protein, partial [Rhodoferax sp.]